MDHDNRVRIREMIRIEIKNDLMSLTSPVNGPNVIAERISDKVVDKLESMTEISEKAINGYVVAESMGSCFTDGWRAAMRFVNKHHGVEADLECHSE